MKVLHLIKFDDVGGIGRHVRSLLRGLAATGEVEPINLVSIDALCTDHHRDYGYLTALAGCWGAISNLAISPLLPGLVPRLRREHRLDTVYLHFPDPLSQFVASLLPGGVRGVIFWHGDIVRQQWAMALYQPLLKSMVWRAEATVGATAFHFSGSTQLLVGEGRPQRVVITYGFDASEFQPSAANQDQPRELVAERWAACGFVLFALGRHGYYKGFDILLRVMAAIDAVLCLGGNGMLTDELEAIEFCKGFESKVPFVSRILEDELIAYDEATDVLMVLRWRRRREGKTGRRRHADRGAARWPAVRRRHQPAALRCWPDSVANEGHR